MKYAAIQTTTPVDVLVSMRAWYCHNSKGELCVVVEYHDDEEVPTTLPGGYTPEVVSLDQITKPGPRASRLIRSTKGGNW